MAIITIGGVDYQSYVTVEEATTYFVGRVHDEDWVSQENENAEVLEKALITATQLLDNLPWAGYSSSATQPLAWPRTGRYYSRRLGRTLQFDNAATEAPEQVKTATYELAYHLVLNTDVLNNPASVNALSAGPIILNDISKESIIPSRIRGIISDFLVNGGSRQVFVGA